MLVLQSLGFYLIVYTPYRSIQGFIDDMEDFCYSTGVQIDLLKVLQQRSFTEADRAMVTDAPPLFPPGHVLEILSNDFRSCICCCSWRWPCFVGQIMNSEFLILREHSITPRFASHFFGIEPSI
ncbi:hypothetical protein RND81_12G146400 [Saponaria officinalis]|uniref:Uncharacterized protein n=1 Tax=Saponaria officinalis TaxID=3572 RepID=A0AAW1HAP9_SAPOF